MVKWILHNSYICWRHQGKPCLVVPPPPLPAFCVQEAPPFTKTSVDFAGLLYVKSSSGGQSKVWIALHTSCVTRHPLGACSGHVHPRIYPKLQETMARPSKLLPSWSWVLCPVQKYRHILMELVLIGDSVFWELHGGEAYLKDLCIRQSVAWERL